VITPEFKAMLNANPPDPALNKMIFSAADELRELATRSTLLGASGAVFGLIAGAAYLFPNDVFYIYALFPLKLKWIALGYGVVELYLAIQNNPQDPVAHIAHLGGALIGFLMVYFSYRRGNRRKLF
jgi:membrane associated rhomboid family serine protease